MSTPNRNPVGVLAAFAVAVAVMSACTTGPECSEPADAWLDTLASAFYPEHKDATIARAAYIEADTSDGTAYYVALEVEGVEGVAVFGTSEAPLQADPGLIAAANAAAEELTDLGIDIPSDSPAGEQLKDLAATSEAATCLEE